MLCFRSRACHGMPHDWTLTLRYNMLMHRIVNSLPHEQTADEEYHQLLEDRREAEKMIAHGTLTYYPDGEAMVKDILS